MQLQLNIANANCTTAYTYYTSGRDATDFGSLLLVNKPVGVF